MASTSQMIFGAQGTTQIIDIDTCIIKQHPQIVTICFVSCPMSTHLPTHQSCINFFATRNSPLLFFFPLLPLTLAFPFFCDPLNIIKPFLLLFIILLCMDIMDFIFALESTSIFFKLDNRYTVAEKKNNTRGQFSRSYWYSSKAVSRKEIHDVGIETTANIRAFRSATLCHHQSPFVHQGSSLQKTDET